MSTKKSTAVAVVTEVGSVGEGIALINQQLASLTQIMETKYQTKGEIPGFSTKIQEETKIETLISMHASVTTSEESYNRSADSMGLTSVPVYKINGHNATDYLKDIEFRIQVLSHKELYEELSSIKKEYEEIMDKEDRKKLIDAKAIKVASRLANSSK